LSVACVGSVLTARVGDARTSPPWPQPKSLAAGPRAIFGHALRVCAKITSGFGGSAAWPDARREEGASPFWGCDRRATPQPARRRPAPEGWGDFAFWLRFSSVAEPWLCSFVVPRQKAKSPPAKPEFIFAQTLSPLQRRTPERARKQPEGCGPHGFRFKGHVHGPEANAASHEPDGRASLSPASRVGRVPRTSSGSPGRTRPPGLIGGEHGSKTKETFHERPPLPSCGHPLPLGEGEGMGGPGRGEGVASHRL